MFCLDQKGFIEITFHLYKKRLWVLRRRISSSLCMWVIIVLKVGISYPWRKIIDLLLLLEYAKSSQKKQNKNAYSGRDKLSGYPRFQKVSWRSQYSMYLWVLYKDPVIERMGLKIYVLDIRLGLSLRFKICCHLSMVFCLMLFRFKCKVRMCCVSKIVWRYLVRPFANCQSEWR